MNPNLREILKLSIPEKILAVEAIWDNIAAENSKYRHNSKISLRNFLYGRK